MAWIPGYEVKTSAKLRAAGSFSKAALISEQKYSRIVLNCSFSFEVSISVSILKLVRHSTQYLPSAFSLDVTGSPHPRHFNDLA